VYASRRRKQRVQKILTIRKSYASMYKININTKRMSYKFSFTYATSTLIRTYIKKKLVHIRLAVY
jgi:uncharacterized protein Veg